MTEWEFDFGQIGVAADKLEFWVVVDRGTSALVDLQGSGGYTAESALLALAQTLLQHGCPQRIRFDNDPRFAPITHDGFPSALERFLLCLDIEVHKCDPASPWQKPFVERAIGTIKHEYLSKHQPTSLEQGITLLEVYPAFYNHQRPNQAITCNNFPPYIAFPQLPTVPSVPELVDLAHWLHHSHGTLFRRTVGSNGSVKINNNSYYIGQQLAKQRIILALDGYNKSFRALHHNKVIKVLPIKGLQNTTVPFQQFVYFMSQQARSMARLYRMKKVAQRR